MEERFCKKCKAIRSKYSEFCSECGTKLEKIKTINKTEVD